MSFITRRRPARPKTSHDSPRPEWGAESPNTVSTSNGKPISNSPPPIPMRKRLSSLSFLTSRSSSKSPRKHAAAQENLAVEFPSRDYSRSPSPDPSLDIRLPTGLGRRASAIWRSSFTPPHTGSDGKFPTYEPPARESVSSPDLLENEILRWKKGLVPVEESLQSETREQQPPVMRVPAEVLAVIFTYTTRADLTLLARVSKAFHYAALSALYKTLDLQSVEDVCVEKCITTLASKRDIAGLVRRFACSYLPSPQNGAVSVMTVTFAIAFTNMHQLTSLVLPRFDAPLLFHISFRLKKLTFLLSTISRSDLRDMLAWLVSQPAITSLSLPNLVIDTLGDLQAEFNASTPSGEDEDAQNTPPSLPAHLLPVLSEFHGPASVASVVVPGRPVERIVLNIHKTLYDGLKPSAIMSALARSKTAVKRVCIMPTSSKVDARTLERVFMSLGAELGKTVEELEVQWVLEDEILYKQILAMLSRFKSLRTLRLVRRCPPPPPSSPPPSSPLPPTLPPSPSSFDSQSPTSARNRLSMTIPYASELPLSRAHERSHLTLWQRQCAALRNVVFLSGAEWRIQCRMEGGCVAAPMFVYTGQGQR